MAAEAQQGLRSKPDGTTPLSGQQADDIRAGPDRSHRHGGRPDCGSDRCHMLTGTQRITQCHVVGAVAVRPPEHLIS